MRRSLHSSSTSYEAHSTLRLSKLQALGIDAAMLQDIAVLTGAVISEDLGLNLRTC